MQIMCALFSIALCTAARVSSASPVYEHAMKSVCGLTNWGMLYPLFTVIGIGTRRERERLDQIGPDTRCTHARNEDVADVAARSHEVHSLPET